MSTPRSIFVNLPVKDLDKTVAFWKGLGFEFNPQFTDDNAACLILSDQGFVMLLVEDFFKTFTKKDLADTVTHIETINALGASDRQEVDRLADAALASGAQPANDPMDHGFMYSRSFFDLDGHMWELVWMDPAALQQ